MRIAIGILVLSVVGCAPEGPAEAEPRSIAELPAALGELDAEPPKAPSEARFPLAATRPGPNRARGDEATRESQRCMGCHPTEAAAFRGSQHQRAYLDEAFQAAHAMEPAPFCRGCHAPEADPRRLPTPAEAAHGVGCVSCHVVDEGTVLAAANDGRDRDEPETDQRHAIRYSTDFAHTGACVGCHEFPFPFARGDDDGAFMQTTVREHARSPSAGSSCASCHMPRRGGRAHHGFEHVRDPKWIKAMVRIEAEPIEGRGVRITLTPREAGHAFPTGDLFRRVAIGAELRDERGHALASQTVYLARRLELVPGRPGRTLTLDDRLEGVPRSFELDFEPDARARSIRSWVTLERVAQTFRGDDPAAARIESTTPLFHQVQPLGEPHATDRDD